MHLPEPTGKTIGTKLARYCEDIVSENERNIATLKFFIVWNTVML
jgi:hypothetical protein